MIWMTFLQLRLYPNVFTGRTEFEKRWLHNPHRNILEITVYGRKIYKVHKHRRVLWEKSFNLWLPWSNYTDSEKKFLAARSKE